MQVVASIQARMGSSRLPGKVLTEICGKPMLLWQVERIRRSRLVDRVIVGTSTSELDDKIEDFCCQNSIEYYRGSEDDVLNRIASLLRHISADLHIECCGDSPLIDPQIIDEFIGYYFKNSTQAEYFSSALETTYPPGLEVNIYPASVLIEVEKRIAPDDSDREHVGYNITKYPLRYRQKSLVAPPWFYAPEVYLEVDTKEDLVLLRKIVSHFVDKGQVHFGLGEILSYLRQQPELIKINQKVKRRWRELRE